MLHTNTKPSARFERKDGVPAEGDDVKTIIGKLGRAFEEFKASHAQEMLEIKKKGCSDTLTADKIDRLNKGLDALEEAKKAVETRLDDMETKLNRSAVSGSGDSREELVTETKAFNDVRRSTTKGKMAAEVTPEQYQEYKTAFESMVRNGENSLLSDAERKALAVGADPDGGYWVPPALSARIIQKVYETSPVRQIANVQTISTDALEGMYDNDEAGSGGWVTETGTRSETTTPQLGKWRIPVHEMYAQPKATQQLLDDAVVDVESWLAGKVSDKLTRVENASFITGDGVGKPQGFTKYTTVATGDASRAWGQLEHVVTGVSADFDAKNSADTFFDLEAAFKPAYLANAVMVAPRAVIQKMRKIKDGNGQYMWQPGLVLGKPQSFLGYSVLPFQDMPALASGSLSLAMGDFREGYQIVDRQGFRVIRDNLTAKPYVLFYTTRRVGGGVLNFEAIKFLKFGT